MHKVKILYTNWKGVTRERTIEPIEISFKATEWHKEPTWILDATDIEKNEVRGIAVKDIHSWNEI